MKAPELTEECVEYAANFYSALRKKAHNYDQNRIAAPITVRTLETLLRLATAHAKLKLATTVEAKDIEVAAKMVNHCIF